MLGLDLEDPSEDVEEQFRSFGKVYGDRYDFYFIHVKEIDAAGEAADFEHKVQKRNKQRGCVLAASLL